MFLTMKKQCVLVFATSYLPLIGGAQFAVHEISSRNANMEFVLYCAKIKRKTARVEKIGAVTVHRIGLGNPLDKFLLPILGPIDALIRNGRKRLVIWGVMAQYGGMAALIYHYLSLKRNPFVLTLQEGGDPSEMKRKAGIFLLFMKLVVRKCTHLQVISNSLLTWARDLGFKGERFFIIPNGVNVEQFSPTANTNDPNSLRKRLGVDKTHRILFSASRLAPKNGMMDLVRAVKLLSPSYIVIIAGDGKQRVMIEEYMKVEQLTSRVILLGDIPPEHVTEHLHVAEIFVRPSLSEGLGNAFLEAMAAGVPVIGTPVGGIPDFLTDGVTGLMASPNDPVSIANCVRAYENPNLYSKIRKRGIELVGEKYTWQSVSGQMGNLLSCTRS